MAIVNFWVATDVIYAGPTVLSLLPDAGQPGPSTTEPPPQIIPAFLVKLADQLRILVSPDPDWQILSYYVRIDDLSDIVPLREELQFLEQEYPDNFFVAGMWHFETGEPVGGVGSPWFVTPPETANYLPNSSIEDLSLAAGQAKRKFV